MPKVKPLTKRSREEVEVLTEIGSTMAVLGISRAELARKTGINPSTFQKRMDDIGSMRLSELWAIRAVRKKAGVEIRGEYT